MLAIIEQYQSWTGDRLKAHPDVDHQSRAWACVNQTPEDQFETNITKD